MKFQTSSYILSAALLIGGIGYAPVAAATGIEASKASHDPLTMQKMRSYYAAQLNIMKAVAESKNREWADTLSIDPDAPFEKTVAQYDEPHLKKALTQAGLSAREFVSIGYSFMNASFGFAYEKMKNGQLDKVYDRANVDFVKAHQQELAILQKQLTDQMEKVEAKYDQEHSDD